MGLGLGFGFGFAFAFAFGFGFGLGWGYLTLGAISLAGIPTAVYPSGTWVG